MTTCCSPRRRMWRCISMAGVLGGLILLPAIAAGQQTDQPGPPAGAEFRPDQPGPPRGPEGRGFGPPLQMPGRVRAMRMFPGAFGGVALAAHGDYVYVLRGNTLYQFAAAGLKLIKKVTLEEERPPFQPRRGPGMMGPEPRPGAGPLRAPEAKPLERDRPRRPETAPPEPDRPGRPESGPPKRDRPKDE